MYYEDNRVKDLKVAYIGGGSRGWAWGFMMDLAADAQMEGTVALYDIDHEAAEHNEIIGNKISAHPDAVSHWKYTVADTLQQALTGADFVVISILPGTFDEMESDVHAPEAYGIYQSGSAGENNFFNDLDITAQSTSDYVNYDLSNIPDYDGKAYVELNGNVPEFSKSEKTYSESFEEYGKLDSLGRCTYAVSCIGKDLMPTEKRGSIGSVKPSGWHISKYDFVDGKYLYNRCHLIGYQLTAENANERNLITGTRYLNVEGMLPFENDVADYIEITNNHVYYKVTPIFEGNNLVANGVQMQAYSVEDNGQGISFNVYCYNVQPGVAIDYATGDNQAVASSSVTSTSSDVSDKKTYIVNTKTKKFHNPDCDGVKKMSSSNKKKYKGTRDSLISNGYSPCQKCNP